MTKYNLRKRVPVISTLTIPVVLPSPLGVTAIIEAQSSAYCGLLPVSLTAPEKM